MSLRQNRIGDLRRAELSVILRRDMADPRIGLATVTDVDVSPDLRQARVQISFIGDAADRRACIDALQHARGFIRSRLAKNLRHLRVQPDLDFELDLRPEYSQQISDLLEGLHDDE